MIDCRCHFCHCTRPNHSIQCYYLESWQHSLQSVVNENKNENVGIFRTRIKQ